MIKVCHITSVHSRYDIRIFQKECSSLVDAGYQVVLFVCDEQNNEICNGVQIKSLGYKPKNRKQRMLKTDSEIINAALEEKAVIYHFHDPELLRFAKKLQKNGAKVIFDSHEFYTLQLLEKKYIPQYLRKYVKLAYSYLEKKWLKYVDAVIVPCTIDGKNYFSDRAKQTCFISNVPKLDEFYGEKLDGEKILCQAGGLTYNRGIWHLVKAMEYIDAKLILAGSFESIEFQKQIESLDHQGKVKYLGYLDREGIRKIYQRTSIGIATMLNKGQYYHIDTLATKVYEFMLMGIPVVLSDTPYVKKVLKQYPFGIAVDASLPNEIANAVNDILAHKEVARQMGEAGRRAIKERYNWEKEAEKLKKLYFNLLPNIMGEI